MEDQRANRRSKAISKHTKQPQQICKKCLNSVYPSVSEDGFIESPTDSIEFSPILKIYDQLSDSAESFIASRDPLISPSSSSNLSPLLPTVSAYTNQNAIDIVNRINSTSCGEIVSIEAEMVVHHLKQAKIQVNNSTNSDIPSKKLLDALIDPVTEEFNALPEEKDQFSKLVSLKTQVMFMSFFLWILVVCMVLLFSFRVRSSINEPPPT